MVAAASPGGRATARARLGGRATARALGVPGARLARAVACRAPARPRFARSKGRQAEAVVAAREFADGKRLVESRQYGLALERFVSAMHALGCASSHDVPPTPDLQRAIFVGKGTCHLHRREWWEAVEAFERASIFGNGQQDVTTARLQGRALRELGLLYSAEQKVRLAADRLDTPETEFASEPLLAVTHEELIAAISAVDEGRHEAVSGEIERLRLALPQKEAASWMYTVQVRCGTEDGRQEYIGHGFLRPEWLTLPPHQYIARVTQKLLMHQVKHKLQQTLSMLDNGRSAQSVVGRFYECASPSSLRHPGATGLLQEMHWQQLREDGLTVVDGAFDMQTMRRWRVECEMLDGAGLMSGDNEDVCNPLQRRMDIPLSDPGLIERSRGDAPTLFSMIEHIRGLPALLEEKLGLQLRVPQVVMLACYPPGAFYRRHLDSYAGKDIPRKVTILLYCNPDWEAEDGGALRVWIGGRSVDYAPKAGRLIIFMSQEIWHEVLHSTKERFAMTLWIWDREKDRLGR